MSVPLVLRPEAAEDLAAARDWYEQQRQGLGEEFLTAAEAMFEQIRTMPELYAVVLEDVRRSKLRRFPYVVYYRVLTDRIEVLAVLHAAIHEAGSLSCP